MSRVIHSIYPNYLFLRELTVISKGRTINAISFLEWSIFILWLIYYDKKKISHQITNFRRVGTLQTRVSKLISKISHLKPNWGAASEENPWVYKEWQPLEVVAVPEGTNMPNNKYKCSFHCILMDETLQSNISFMWPII